MSPLSLGLWAVIAIAIPATVVLIVSVCALHGSAPSERPEILRALAELVAALRRRKHR